MALRDKIEKNDHLLLLLQYFLADKKVVMGQKFL